MAILENERDSQTMSRESTKPDRARQAEGGAPRRRGLQMQERSLELNRLKAVSGCRHPANPRFRRRMRRRSDEAFIRHILGPDRASKISGVRFRASTRERRGGLGGNSKSGRRELGAYPRGSSCHRGLVRPFVAGAISSLGVIARCWSPKETLFSRSTEPRTNCWTLCVAGAQNWLGQNSRADGERRRARSRGHANLMLPEMLSSRLAGSRARRLHPAKRPPLQRRLLHFSRAAVCHDRDWSSCGRADPRLKRLRNAALSRLSWF